MCVAAERAEPMALYLPELPLQHGKLQPLSGEGAGCVSDAAPDAWGRRVIEHRRGDTYSDLPTLTYLGYAVCRPRRPRWPCRTRRSGLPSSTSSPKWIQTIDITGQ